jgi:hypothetical protein
MKNVFESCEMTGVVDGSETIPPDDPAHIAKQWIWKKDNLAKAMIISVAMVNDRCFWKFGIA